MNETIKQYLKIHWVPMLLGAIPTTLVAIVSFINLFIAFRVDYIQLKLAVQANTNAMKDVIVIRQQILSNELAIKQKADDQQTLLINIQDDIRDIHRYFFDGKK